MALSLLVANSLCYFKLIILNHVLIILNRSLYIPIVDIFIATYLLSIRTAMERKKMFVYNDI